MESGAGSAISQRDVAAAVDAASAALSELSAAGPTPLNSRDAVVCLREIEVLRRRMDAISVDLVSEIDEQGLYGEDGHRSGKTMAALYGNLSSGEAAGRERIGKVMTAMPEVAKAYRSGQIGTNHMRVLGRLHANPRVRHQLRDNQAWFLARAKRSDFDTFEKKTLEWMERVDDDGPDPAVERSHELRDVKLNQDYDKSWNLFGSFGAAQGAAIHEIFEHYLEAETKADWEKARAEFGEAATYSDLPRSVQQRRADAFWQMAQDAAASPNGAVPPGFVHNIVWDQTTFEEMARRVETGEMSPLDPDQFRCQTIDGVRLDPYESFASALNSRIRRVLIDSASVTIDLGEARFFTGLARHAVKLGFTECVWVGCHVPSSQCEADHLVEHSKHGRTNPGNGAPLCGRHNRWKQKGFSVYRDPSGGWHTYRPDGTEIPTH